MINFDTPHPSSVPPCTWSCCPQCIDPPSSMHAMFPITSMSASRQGLTQSDRCKVFAALLESQANIPHLQVVNSWPFLIELMLLLLGSLGMTQTGPTQSNFTMLYCKLAKYNIPADKCAEISPYDIPDQMSNDNNCWQAWSLAPTMMHLFY